MQTTWSTDSLTVRIQDRHVVVERAHSSPSRDRYELSEAFHAPHRLHIDAVQVRAEVVASLAHRLTPDACLTEVDRLRLPFWASLQRVSSAPLRLDFSDARGAAVTVELNGDHLCIGGSRYERDSRSLLDDVFFYGPKVSGMPLASQRALRAAVYTRLKTGSGLAERDGFPLIEPRQLEAGQWEWDKQADGEAAAVLDNGLLLIGYSYGRSHQQGYGYYPLARTLRQAPGLYLGCPEAVEEAIRARLAAAVVA